MKILGLLKSEKLLIFLIEVLEKGVTPGLLNETYSSRTSKKKRPWYFWCQGLIKKDRRLSYISSLKLRFIYLILGISGFFDPNSLTFIISFDSLWFITQSF